MPFRETILFFDDLFGQAPLIDLEQLPEADASTPFLKRNELSDAEPGAEPVEKEQQLEDKNPETNEPFSDNLVKLRAYIN